MSTEIIWRSPEAPLYEADSIFYTVEARLEGMHPQEEWVIVKSEADIRDASRAVAQAEKLVGTDYPYLGGTSRIVATRVTKHTI